jgi:hypothetical protein
MRGKQRNGKEQEDKQPRPNGTGGSRRRKRPKRGRHLPRHRLPQKAVVRRRRLVLSDLGLSVLARRDRTSVGAMKKRWSACSVDPDRAATWEPAPRQSLHPLD